ncbi:hypothetical protein [Polaribacter sp. R77954]|uniref:hypothetical protein n=1 Tax=Polaribacter sp. R77954 TaxID=3093870 RepID=UPI0037CB4863
MYSYFLLKNQQRNRFLLVLLLFCAIISNGQITPKILFDTHTKKEHYLPDFSFAGYHNGEKNLPNDDGTIVLASDFGVIANDGLDDSKKLIKAIKEASKINGKVTLQLPAGRLIISEIIYLERSNFVLKGAGSGNLGTEIYFPRPLMYNKNPEDLKELREYLLQFDKRQREKKNNIDLPFSQYAWSGGFIWTRVPGERVKSYLEKYKQPFSVKTKIKKGKRGTFSFEVDDTSTINIGDVLLLQIFNKNGKESQIIYELYQNTDVKIGSHHWNFPDLPLVTQQIEVTAIKKNTITIKTPLTIDILPKYNAQLVEWKHLKEVGIENIKLTFPKSPRVAHHVEPGFNGIFLTRVYNSWVKNIVIENADSGILTEEIANTTIKNITTTGQNIAHYTVAMAGVHNVLGKNIKVYNKAVHPLSFNTFSTKNVYLDCEVFVDPILDQHSGANHQNLFDNISVHLNPKKDHSYPLFAGGGAGYWKPSHGAYSTFWNIHINFLSSLNNKKPLVLNGMKDGPFARLIGVYGNHPITIDYKPNAYIEATNVYLKNIPSLYHYQLNKRLNN